MIDLQSIKILGSPNNTVLYSRALGPNNKTKIEALQIAFTAKMKKTMLRLLE